MKRIFFATDLHGSETSFMKFLNAAKAYKADAIVLGGDMTGKALVPIISRSDGTFEASFLGQKWKCKNRTEEEDLEKKIRSSGQYAYLADEEQIKELDSDTNKLDDAFRRLMLATMEKWDKIAGEKLQGTGLRIHVTAGNDDPFFIDKILGESRNFVHCEGQVIQLTPDHEMVSTGYTNVTPWKCPRDIPEEELLTRIETICNKVNDVDRCIFNFHCPPIDSGLDTCPMLDTSVNPPQLIYRAGQLVTFGAGSTAVRKVIEEKQPLCTLHGHIHESRAATKIKKTLCLNPGSEYAEGVLRGVIVNLNQEKVKSFQFTSG